MNEEPARPAWASRGLPWTGAEFAALDFELTGLDAAKDSVISIGVVPVLDGRIVLAGSVYRTVGPESELRSRSIVVHGLLPEDLADAPPIDEARPVLAGALDGRYLLTWAAEVEAAFLAKLFRRSERSWLRRSVDVLGLAMLADRLEPASPDRRDYTLVSVADRFGISMEQPHHAFDDALTTAQLFLILVHEVSGGGHITPRRLLRLSRRGRRLATTP